MGLMMPSKVDRIFEGGRCHIGVKIYRLCNRLGLSDSYMVEQGFA